MRSAMMIAAVVAACGGACGGTQPPPRAQAFADPDPGSDSDPGSEPDPRSPAPDPDLRSPVPAEDPRGEAGDSRVAPPDPGPDQSSIATQYVTAHNTYRKKHCAPPLTWSPELAKTAQSWADQLKKAGCAFEHSRTRFGENLAGGTSGALDPAGATEMWYREVDKYDFQKGGFSMATGHFTQVVWTATQRIGCGMTTCNGLDIIVCNYDPPGNVEGGYRNNVKPTGCK